MINALMISDFITSYLRFKKYGHSTVMAFEKSMRNKIDEISEALYQHDKGRLQIMLEKADIVCDPENRPLSESTPILYNTLLSTECKSFLRKETDTLSVRYGRQITVT